MQTQTTAQSELDVNSARTAPTSSKFKTRGPKYRPAVDLNSPNSADYNDWARAKGWSYSKGLRAKQYLPVIRVDGFSDRIIPLEAELVLRGERPSRRPPPRRSRGRPRGTT